MSDHAPFELYAYWRSSAAFRVRVALRLKGIAANERLVDVEANEQRGAAFLAINPLGGIPALIEAGHTPLTQSLSILEFLDELQPDPPLLPKDLHGRARVRSLAGMLASDTHPLLTPRIRKYLAATGASAGTDAAAWRAWQTHWLSTGMAALEQRLATERETGAFCHGDQVTMADICLASLVATMRVFKIDIPDIPTVHRIMARCDAIDAFALAAPHRQVGAPA